MSSARILIVPCSLTSLYIKPCRRSRTNPSSRMAASKPKDGSWFLANRSLRHLSSGLAAQRDSNTKMDLVVRSSVQPGAPIPSDPIPPPNSWKGWILGTLITVALPFLWNKWGSLLKFNKEIEAAVETAEHVAEGIERAAEEVEKVAEEVASGLPEGGKIRNAIEFVENAAKQTVKVADLTEEIIDKVEVVEKEVEPSTEGINDRANGTAEEANDQK